jgi:hypothetical protein
MFGTVTPSNLTPSWGGNCERSSSRLISPSTAREAMGSASNQLRVICRKLAYLIFTVTVRPSFL